MNVIEAIQARRATRSYQARVVEDDKIRALLRAAVQAPSAVNAQAWVFAVVQSASTLKRWSDRAKAMLLNTVPRDPKVARHLDHLGDPNFNIFYDASTLIVIGVNERGTYTDADCWLAAENLMLAAVEVGLATCPIGFALPVLNTPEVKGEIRVGSAGAAVAPILLGYAANVPTSVARSEPHVTAWIR
ncbi:MAG: nitroreductase family protein [Polyangiaceae bacterium]